MSTYGRKEQALNYIDVCLELIKMIGGQDENNFEVLKRFEKSLSNTDRLTQILYQFDSNVSRNLVDKEHRDLGVMMLVGAFIEALYITTQIIDSYPKDVLPDNMGYQVLSPLISIVLDQKGFLRNLIRELDNLDGKEKWEIACLNSLNELYHTYNKPLSKFYPSPQERPSFNRILLLSVQIDSIRANIIY